MGEVITVIIPQDHVPARATEIYLLLVLTTGFNHQCSGSASVVVKSFDGNVQVDKKEVVAPLSSVNSATFSNSQSENFWLKSPPVQGGARTVTLDIGGESKVAWHNYKLYVE